MTTTEPWRNDDGSVNAGRCWRPFCLDAPVLVMSSNHPAGDRDVPLCHEHAVEYAGSVVTAAFDGKRGNTHVMINPL